jgi:hypothetical protein
LSDEGQQARDQAGFDSLIDRMTTPPPDPEAELVPKPTSYDALARVMGGFDADREAEAKSRSKWERKFWDSTRKEAR